MPFSLLFLSIRFFESVNFENETEENLTILDTAGIYSFSVYDMIRVRIQPDQTRHRRMSCFIIIV